MVIFNIVGSAERIEATCACKKVTLVDSHIIYPNVIIKSTVDTKTTFALIEGDELIAA